MPSQQNQSILGQPPSLPTNHLAPPTSLMGAPPTTGTQVFQTQASFFNPMGLSFMASPLQALQNLRSSTNQQSAYSNQSYSTLSVSGSNAGSTAPQQVTAYGQLAAHSTSPTVVNTGKMFLPSTPVGQRGIQPQQLIAQKLTPQQLPPQQMSVQHITPQQRGAQHVMTPQQLGVQQIAPQQMSAQNLPPRQVNAQNLTHQQLSAQNLTPQQLGVSQLTPQQLNVQRLTPQQLSVQQLTSQQLAAQQLTSQQLHAQQLTAQQLRAQQLTPQQLNTQHQSLLAPNTLGIGMHQLPHAATISPVIRNISTGLPSQPHQQPSLYTMLPHSQKRLATAPHMLQPSLSSNPQMGTLAHSQLTQASLLTCSTSTIPNQVPPIMTQHHIPVTMPTGVGGGTLNSMNVGTNRVPQQLTTPTRPPRTADRTVQYEWSWTRVGYEIA